MNSQKTEYTLYLSYDAFGCNRRKGIILLQLKLKGMALMYETENFLSSLSWSPILSLFYPFIQQSRISENYSKDVNLTRRKINFGCYPAVLWH
jgi:hypothetical protein